MSLNYRRSQVERLSKDLAALEGKLAQAHERAARSRAAALRVSGSISKSTSASSAAAKLREARRHEEAAVADEKKAADISAQIAAKRKASVAAQHQVSKAEESERKKQVAAVERQRRDDLRRIAELERARRVMPVGPFAPVESVSSPASAAATEEFEYEVCLSYAGEQRSYVEMVARGLEAASVRCFYDEDEKVKLWGKDLVEEFDRIYRRASRYCVMFISADYARKEWTRHERRSALARALTEQGVYVLPARFDDTELPGLPPTTAYLNLSEIAPDTLVKFIVETITDSAADGRQA